MLNVKVGGALDGVAEDNPAKRAAAADQAAKRKSAAAGAAGTVATAAAPRFLDQGEVGLAVVSR